METTKYLKFLSPRFTGFKVGIFRISPISYIVSHCIVRCNLTEFDPSEWNPISIRFFKSHRIFSPSYNTFYEEINVQYTLLCLSQASYTKIKALAILRELQSDFCKSLTKFYQFLLKIFPSHRFQSTAYGMYAIWNDKKVEINKNNNKKQTINLAF